MEPVISFISKKDLTKLMKIDAVKVGWSFSSFDIDFHFSYAANKIYAIKFENEIAGCIILHESSGRIEDKTVTSIGFFIVIDKFRGKKIVGPKLWDTIRNNLNQSKFICFNAAPQAFPFYQRNGFEKTTFISTKYSVDINKFERKQISLSMKFSNTHNLKIIKIENIDDINIFNEKIFPHKSGQGFRDFIRSWVLRPDAVKIGYYEQNTLKGYGVLTLCQDNQESEKVSYRISPVYADTCDIANILVDNLIDFAITQHARNIELFTLEGPGAIFSSHLFSRDFIEAGINYVVSNYPEAIKPTPVFLNKIYAILPLEYPCEIVASI